jgi:hypothetical protein
MSSTAGAPRLDEDAHLSVGAADEWRGAPEPSALRRAARLSTVAGARRINGRVDVQP